MISESTQAILALLLMALPANAADKRTIVTLKGSTVADVLSSRSEVDGHIGFNVPLAPHFTERGLFRSFPKGMTEYPALFTTETGTITTAAMIRFIKNGHTLFNSAEDQAAYKKLLKTCIAAHKAWYATKSTDNLVTLRIAEGNIFNLLRRLSLTNSAIRDKLEKLLSSPSKNALAKTYHKLVLPKRAWIAPQKDAIGSPAVKKSHPLANTAKQLSLSLGAFYIYVRCYSGTINKIVIGEVLPARAKVKTYRDNHPIARKAIDLGLNLPALILLSTLITSSYAAFTDFKLAPEPGNGIKVVIKYASPEAAVDKA